MNHHYYYDPLGPFLFTILFFIIVAVLVSPMRQSFSGSSSNVDQTAIIREQQQTERTRLKTDARIALYENIKNIFLYSFMFGTIVAIIFSAYKIIKMMNNNHQHNQEVMISLLLAQQRTQPMPTYDHYKVIPVKPEILKTIDPNEYSIVPFDTTNNILLVTQLSTNQQKLLQVKN